MKIKLIFILVVSTLLLSCSNGPKITIEGNKTIKEKGFFKTTTIKPTRIIRQGLGLSFNTSIEDVKKEGFISRSSLVFKEKEKRKYAGQWIKYMKKDDFWDNKEITIHPNTTYEVRQIGANKYYHGEASVEGECISDLYLISGTLKEKYPELINIRRVEGVHFFPDNVEGRTKLTLAEGQKETLVFLDGAYSTNIGLGRNIHLQCRPFGNKGVEENNYVLELEYHEDHELLFPERSEADKKIMRNNQLKDKKIDIKEL